MSASPSHTIRTRLLAQDAAVMPRAPLMAPLIFFSAALHGFLIILFVGWPNLFPARKPKLVPLMTVRTISLPTRPGEINPGGAPAAAPARPDAGTPAPVATPAPAPAPPPSEPAIRPAGKSTPAPTAPPKSAPAAATPGVKSAPAGSEGPRGSAPGPGGWGGGTGPASGGGTGVAFDEDFAQTWYQAALERKIKSAWHKPPLPPGTKRAAQIHFVIGAGGKILESSILTPSGDEAFDRSALGAVLAAQPLPALPATYGKATLGAIFQFQSAD